MFEGDVVRHDQNVAALESQLGNLAPSIETRASWERKHQTQLDRIDTLDRQIRLTERLDRSAARDLGRELEVGLCIEL